MTRSIDIMEQTMIQLLNKQSFYAYLMMQFVRMKSNDDKKIPTAGVSIRGVTPILCYNENWLKNAPSDDYRVEVLIHEAAHIIRGHLYRGKALGLHSGNVNFHNICMDLAINEYLPVLKEYSNNNKTGQYVGITTEQMEEAFDVKLEKKMPYEYYVEQLRPFAKDIDAKYKSLDSHDWGGEPGDQTEQVKDLVRKAMCKAKGSIPSDLKHLLDELLKTEVDWKRQLRLFVNTIKTREKEKTRKKLNRRYGLLNPGRRRKDATKIAVAVDTSGSMWNLLPKVMSEVYEIAKHSEVWVIECDVEVKKTYKADPKNIVDFSGCGGTSYQPAIDKATEIGVSGMIYLGDMDACDANQLKQPPFKVLWGIFGSSNPPAKWGKVLRIKD